MGEKINHSISINLGKQTIEERACNLARYIIDSKDTVRGAAKKFRNKQKHRTQRRKRETTKNQPNTRNRSKKNTRRKQSRKTHKRWNGNKTQIRDKTQSKLKHYFPT